jgi:hypothetical protein
VRHTLTLVEGPDKEPVTLANVKSWARIDDPNDDTIIMGLISTARTAAEEYIRRSLITQTWKLTLDLSPSRFGRDFQEGVYQMPVSELYGGLPRQIALPKIPVQSVNSITTYSLDNTASTFGRSNYFLDAASGRVTLNFGCIWPANLRAAAACVISYTAGYGDAPSDVPSPIKQAIMIHVATLYEQRGESADAMSLPPGSKQLLNQYRVMGAIS